jgi:hypothetical protein
MAEQAATWFDDVSVQVDLSGRERVLIARRPHDASG